VPYQCFFFLDLSNFNFFDAAVRFGNEDARCAWCWIITHLPGNSEIECCGAPIISTLVNECGGLGRDRGNQTWCRVHRLSSWTRFATHVGGSLGFDSPCPNRFPLARIFSFYFPEHLFWIDFGNSVIGSIWSFFYCEPSNLLMLDYLGSSGIRSCMMYRSIRLGSSKKSPVIERTS
jgi:hypothetical protein